MEELRDAYLQQMREMYRATRSWERDTQEQAFFRLREELQSIARPYERGGRGPEGKKIRDELRSGIGLAALQGEPVGEPDVLMEFVFGSKDKARLDAMRLLYEFFDREEPSRKPRPRSFSLAEMKELAKKSDEWLFRQRSRDRHEVTPPDANGISWPLFVVMESVGTAKNSLASFVLLVGTEKYVEEVVEAEGIMPAVDFLGELDDSMLRQATLAELGQKLARADAELADLWSLFADASFDKGDDLVFSLLLKKHEAELTEAEILFGKFGEQISRGLEETRGHVLISLAAQSREDADLISDESQDEAARYRKSAANKLEQIRKLTAEPAKDAREAAEKEQKITKLRRQRERALAYAQEAAGREAALQKLANTQENKAGSIFDRVEGDNNVNG